MLRSVFTTMSILLLVCFTNLFSQVNFPYGSSFKYLKGSDAVDLDPTWINTDFDDSQWSTGNAPLGRYWHNHVGTELADMSGNYTSLFLRTTFTAVNIDTLQDVTFTVNWNDGFVLFVNGTEVARRNVTGSIAYNTTATEQHKVGEAESFTVSKETINLLEGENVLAVFGCNINKNNFDFLIDVSIQAHPIRLNLPELPDTLGVSFSHKSGFYTDNFTLNLTSPYADANIIYTLDGSNPQTSYTSLTASNTAEITIDPSNSDNRGTTAGVVVRASLIKDGFIPSKPTSRTYLFIEEVKNQAYPGWDWPNLYINSQIIDYDMDQEIVGSGEWGGKITDALLDIPAISIMTDNANLFDPAKGIYVNAKQQGADWERDCTVELLNPDGSEGFNINAGLRIRGGYSRHYNYPKHAFRLFFRKEYGEGKLRFPLFEDEGVARFDKVDLRCAQNYSWTTRDGQHNTFAREVFMRDAQGETGKPYTRSRYYHLYLNGLYWGMFQTQERSEARYASDYLGGDNEDWDVIKRGGVNDHDVGATDGNTDKWQQVWENTQNGYEDDANYYLLEGRDEHGNPMKNSEILVDIDNLIDYMINIFYSGNFDSPVSKFGRNKRPNNFYALTNREDKTQGFIFMVHDAEHTLLTSAVGNRGIGINENRVNIGYLPENNEYHMVVNEFTGFHPQWLHHKLCDNPKYRARFADMAYKRLTNNGIFTEERNIARLDHRTAQIEEAIIAESARWGDMNGEQTFTKDDWTKEISIIRNNYFAKRNDIVIGQLLEYELFPATEAPILKLNGADIMEEYVYLTNASDISVYGETDEIYYTLNGKDPRDKDGNIAASAFKISSGTTLKISSSTVIKIRTLKDDKWSGLKLVNFIFGQTDYSNFKVTELHYHPIDSINGTDTINGKDFEFIEFKNTSQTEGINLSGVSIDSAIQFTFPDNFILPPQQYFVVAAKPKKFYDRYGMIAHGNFKKSFSNAGEQVLVTDANGSSIMDFTYDDTPPWPRQADGEGPSLTSVENNPTGDPNNNSYWTVSLEINGSPSASGWTSMEENVISLADDFTVYPNPTSDVFTIKPSRSVKEFTVNLYDINGRLISNEGYFNSARISMKNKNLNHGIYFVNIVSKNQSQTKKLIYRP